MDLVDQIANAILYEGYILYPYRRSAVKNQQRWNFGVLYPRSYAEAQTGHDPWRMQTECLALVTPQTQVTVRARFLHAISCDGWQEATEREVTIASIPVNHLESPQSESFSFDVHETHVGAIVRRNEALNGEITLAVQRLAENLCTFRVVLSNCTEFTGQTRDFALLKSLLSAHIVLSLKGGEFISLLDPPENFQPAAAACKNIGCWPVLVGPEGARDTMLASPIILYDYPQIAAESAGDLFDGTEIDEILSLRILTLTEDEKREMCATDERARRILQRTEELPAEQLAKMHGTVRR